MKISISILFLDENHHEKDYKKTFEKYHEPPLKLKLIARSAKIKFDFHDSF